MTEVCRLLRELISGERADYLSESGVDVVLRLLRVSFACRFLFETELVPFLCRSWLVVKGAIAVIRRDGVVGRKLWLLTVAVSWRCGCGKSFCREDDSGLVDLGATSCCVDFTPAATTGCLLAPWITYSRSMRWESLRCCVSDVVVRSTEIWSRGWHDGDFVSPVRSCVSSGC